MGKKSWPDKRGHFGIFGGRYVAETIMPALLELEKAYGACRSDRTFQKNLDRYLRDYAGRETPLYLAGNLTEKLKGTRIYLKREDLNQPDRWIAAPGADAHGG
jgi:tryptophan synthase beta chain